MLLYRGTNLATDRSVLRSKLQKFKQLCQIIRSARHGSTMIVIGTENYHSMQR